MTNLLMNFSANLWMLGIVLLFVSVRLVPLTIKNVSVARKRYSHLVGVDSSLSRERSDKVILSYVYIVGNVLLTVMSVQFIMTLLN